MDDFVVETPSVPNKRVCIRPVEAFSLKGRLSDVYEMGSAVSLDFLNFVVNISQNAGKACDIPDSPLTDVLSPVKMLARFGKDSGGDYSSSKVLLLYRRRPAAFLTILSTGSSSGKMDSSLSSFLTFMSELFEISRNLGCPEALLIYIGKLMESHLLGVRFTVTCFAILILHAHARSKRCTKAVLEMLSKRMQDVSEYIRRIVCIDCMVRCSLLVPQLFELPDSAIYTFALNDPSKNNRLYALKFLEDLIRSGRQGVVLHAGSGIGELICQLCFDKDSLEVSRLAIRILSDCELGEFYIGNDVSMYQKIANQVWTDRLVIAREALTFVDNHILAAPGLLGDSDDDEQKLEVLIEFLDQYSDGWIFELNQRLVVLLFDQLSNNNFLLNIDMFMASIGTQMRHVRKEWDDMIHGSQKDFIQVKKRLNTALEILLSVVNLQGDERRSILRETQMAAVFVEMLRDEEDEEFHSVSNILDGCESDPKLRGRRSIVEIVIDIVNSVFRQPEDDACVDMFPFIDRNVLTKDKNARKKGVCLVRNFLKEFCN